MQRLSTPSLKALPTLAESGLKDFQVTIWHGLYAPKGTPAEVVKKINDALKVALKDPDFIKKQEGLGAVVATDKRIEPAEHKSLCRQKSTNGVPSSRPQAPTLTEATPALRQSGSSLPHHQPVQAGCARHGLPHFYVAGDLAA